MTYISYFVKGQLGYNEPQVNSHDKFKLKGYNSKQVQLLHRTKNQELLNLKQKQIYCTSIYAWDLAAMMDH